MQHGGCRGFKKKVKFLHHLCLKIIFKILKSFSSLIRKLYKSCKSPPEISGFMHHKINVRLYLKISIFETFLEKQDLLWWGRWQRSVSHRTEHSFILENLLWEQRLWLTLCHIQKFCNSTLLEQRKMFIFNGKKWVFKCENESNIFW